MPSKVAVRVEGCIIHCYYIPLILEIKMHAPCNQTIPRANALKRCFIYSRLVDALFFNNVPLPYTYNYKFGHISCGLEKLGKGSKKG